MTITATFRPAVPPIATSAHTPRRGTEVPSSYDHFFQIWYPYILQLVRRRGIEYQESEDVAMTIVAHFFRTGALHDFDPDHTTTHGGVTRRTRFITFLTSFVQIYLRHHLDRQRIERVRQRATTYIDAESTSFYEYGPAAQAHHQTEARIEAVATLLVLRRRLAAQQQTSFDAVALFDAMQRQMLTLGATSTSLLAEELGVSQATVRIRISKMAAVLR